MAIFNSYVKLPEGNFQSTLTLQPTMKQWNNMIYVQNVLQMDAWVPGK